MIQSSKWIYGQTPQFTLSSHPTAEDDRERPALPDGFPKPVSPNFSNPWLRCPSKCEKRTKGEPLQARVYLKVKSGVIISSEISVSSDRDTAKREAEKLDRVLNGKSIQDIDDFASIMGEANLDGSMNLFGISNWLNDVFGKQ